MRIKSLEELNEIANSKLNERNSYESEIDVCVGSTCLAMGSADLKDKIEAKLKDEKKCLVKGVGCNGLCAAGALVCVKDKNKKEMTYKNVKEENISDIINSDETKLKDKILDTDIAFFTKQKKIVLENAGIIDPTCIYDYISRDGYKALFQALTSLNPENIIEEVKISGLRGRGGGGYPTGLKWDTVSKVQSSQKYVICNGDEGDPGAFMDRAVMETDPHKIIEGMAIAGYAVGADTGYIYVRAEYPLALKMLQKAIEDGEKLGVIGTKIAGTDFNFHIEVRLGGGAYVCGETTAIVTSIEGNRGHPRQKPPHLSDHGLYGEPTVLNNVETLANIPPIIRNGGKWYASFGTEDSKGTKVIALTGQINNTGLVEVEMGMSLADLIFEVGGGTIEGKTFKAIQTGGSSGGCIPKEFLHLPIEYGALKKAGSILGSGGMIVMDESTSMVDIAKYYMEFCRSESCGKCVPCRVGTTQMYNLLEKFSNKEATNEDLQMLIELCEVVGETSLCGLGETAPNTVLSTLKYFKQEYLEGIKND